jgi:uncharacterized repeat protein (TIGR02543 family)
MFHAIPDHLSRRIVILAAIAALGLTACSDPVSSASGKYSVSYDGNAASGGTVPVDSTEYVSGSTAIVLGNSGSLAKTGYSFSGWNTQADAAGTGYAAGQSLTIGTANVTLYAQWTAATVAVAKSVAAPVIAVGDNHFYQTVSITAGTGTTIYYTDDGSTPTTSSATYSGSFNVAGWGVTKSIKAIAVLSGTSSAVAAKTVAATTWTIMSVSGTAAAWAGMYAPSTSFLDATGTAAIFGDTDAVCTDGQYVYVADFQNDKIRRVSKSDASVTTLCSGSTIWKSCTSASDSAIVTIRSPAAIATDGIWLYVNYNSVGLRKINIVTGAVISLDDMPNSIDAITTDGTNLYMCSMSANVIWKYELATRVRTTLAGSGTAAVVNGTGTGASFYQPLAIVTDGTCLYVADYNNYIIRQVVIASGKVTTLAGSAGASGTTNDQGIAARFGSIYGLAYDGNHTCLYISDNGNSKIRRLDLSTLYVTDVTAMANPNSLTADGSLVYVGTTTRQIWRIQ